MSIHVGDGGADEAAGFFVACAADDVAAVSQAIRAGAALGSIDGSGLTPLHLAVLSGSREVVRVLLEAGADPTAKAAEEVCVLGRFGFADQLRSGSTLPSAGKVFAGESALHMAFGEVITESPADPLIIQLLLDAGADANAQDGSGVTPLAVAFSLLSDDEEKATRQVEPIRMLLAAGADPNIDLGLDQTPLSIVSDGMRGYMRLLRDLLSDAGAMPHPPVGGPSVEVIGAVARLGKALPVDLVPADVVVATPAGKRRLPRWTQTLLAVRWDEGTLCVDDHDLESGVDLFVGYEVDQGLITKQRAWYAIGWHELQYYYVVDLDDDCWDDPMVYRVDHAGGEGRPHGRKLSEVLRGLKLLSTP